MKSILNFVLLFLFINCCQAQKVRPALNLTKGNTYYLASTTNSVVIQSINGQENKIDLNISGTMAFKVLDKTDTVYQMEVTYQALSMTIRSAASTMDIDSKKNDPSDILSSVMKKMTNKPFNISLSRTGKVISVENAEKMISGVFDSFPEMDAAKKEQAKTQFMQSFGPNAFKGSIQSETAFFPDGAVAKNDSWVVNTALEGTIKANSHMTYRLTDISNDAYQIHGDGTTVTDKNAKPMQLNGLLITYNLNGTTTADIKADRKTGWMSEIKLTQQMKGDMQIPDGPSVPGGMNIPMTFTINTSVTDKPQ